MENDNAQNTEPMTIDDIAAKIDAIEVDNNTNSNENNTDGDGSNLKNPDIAALQESITVQAAQIDALTKQLGRMVTMYGARISGENSTVEGFKTLKVEETFEDPKTKDIPLLSDIKLG